jgi:glucose-1-phosphate thymidylyltransferase
MQPVLGKPIIERVLHSLNRLGIEEVIIVLHHKDTDAQAYLRNIKSASGMVRIVEQRRRLGTAHALLQAVPQIGESFILLFCDNIFPDKDVQAFIAHWRNNQPFDGLIALLKSTPAQMAQSAAVRLEKDWVKTIVEKPAVWPGPPYIASVPLYCFSTNILEYLVDVPLSVRNEYELQSAIQKFILSGNMVGGFFISERLSLTSSSDLLDINRNFIRNLGISVVWGELERRKDVKIFPPVVIDHGVTIGSHCQIGPRVYVEQGCEIGGRSIIRESLVLHGSVVAPGSIVDQQVVHP